MSVLRMAIMCILGQIADQNYNLPNTIMTTLYWQVFKNLEREFQELADTIEKSFQLLKDLIVFCCKTNKMLSISAIEDILLC